jgi:hypothetical protein
MGWTKDSTRRVEMGSSLWEDGWGYWIGGAGVGRGL